MKLVLWCVVLVLVAQVMVEASFVHPGIVLTNSHITYTKSQLAKKAEPQTKAFSQLESAKADQGTNIGKVFSSSAWVAHPKTYLVTPTGGSGTHKASDVGCYNEKTDMMAAYANTLYYLYKGDEAHAQTAVKILNAWSSTFKGYQPKASGFDTSCPNSPLQASWTAALFARTCELLRYKYKPSSGKTALNIAAATTLMTKVYLPQVNQVWGGGGANWLMSMCEATLAIAIFTNNQKLFDQAIARFNDQVPSIIYLSTDKNPYGLTGYPIPPKGTMYDKKTVTGATMKKYWWDATKFVNGQEGETCRDPSHMSMSFGSIGNIAETALIQGIDLYTKHKTRVVTGTEVNMAWLNSVLGGKSPSNWPCKNAYQSTTNNAGWKLTYEVLYNAYASRKKVSMPQTSSMLTKYSRPSVYKAGVFMMYEALTHAGTPAPPPKVKFSSGSDDLVADFYVNTIADSAEFPVETFCASFATATAADAATVNCSVLVPELEKRDTSLTVRAVVPLMVTDDPDVMQETILESCNETANGDIAVMLKNAGYTLLNVNFVSVYDGPSSLDDNATIPIEYSYSSDDNVTVVDDDLPDNNNSNDNDDSSIHSDEIAVTGDVSTTGDVVSATTGDAASTGSNTPVTTGTSVIKAEIIANSANIVATTMTLLLSFLFIVLVA